MNNLSLVIINDNAADYCYKLFESIREQVSFENLDLIFIDNCSEDNSIDVAKHYAIKRIYSFNVKGNNLGVIYNKGLELADQKYVIFAHSDIYFVPDFFGKLLDYIEDSSSTYDFTNFKQYYVDLRTTSRDRFGFDLNNKNLCLNLNYSVSQMEVYAECTESCFMINKERLQSYKFEEIFNKSLCVFDFLENVKKNNGVIGYYEECRYVHYYIELHDILKTFPLDLIIYLQNHPHLYEKYMSKQKNLDNVCLRLQLYYSLLNRWLRKHQQSENLQDYFIEKQFRFVAIYGTGELAQNLYRELDDSKVQIVCFVCRESKENNLHFSSKPVISINYLNAFCKKQQIDAVVVTPVYDFESISKCLGNIGCNFAIISLEEIINQHARDANA